ncbi:MAG: ABC transporter ATP-binding protein [Chloroflexota bacterium]|nr:ABC transporter ATP-binding protein [Chloroflexota bacterium]
MMRGGGGMGGGMMRGMRGTSADSMFAPSNDNLTDEDVVGRVYDNRVVMRFMTFIKPYKGYALIALASLLVYAAVNAGIPLLIKYGIDWAVAEGEVGRVHIIGAAFMVITVIHFLSNRLQFIFISRTGQHVLYDLRSGMFSHLQNQSNAFYHRTPIGRIMSRMQSDILQLQETFELLALALAELVTVGAIITLMLIVNWKLALVCMFVVPVLTLIMMYWQRFARHSFMRIRRAIAMVNGEYNQNITGVRVVQSLNRQDENMAHFRTLNQEYLDANLEAARYSGMLQPLVELLIGLGIGLGVVLFGGWLLQRDALEVGTLVAFAFWIQRFFEPIRQLTMQYSQLQRAMAAGVRIFEVLDLDPDINDKPDAVALPEVKGEIRYNDVTFHYVEGVDVLKNINVHINAGENVALVGSTGAGKSTFVNLLHRSADVTGGSISVDGYDLRDVKRESLVHQMSMVLQEPYLFSGTVRENISYQNEELTEDQIIEAAKAVGAHDFIMDMDNGYGSELAERGINLSIGQRQLISFARAIAGNPRILVLDEATANIDTHTELLIQQALSRILKGRTSIVIAHRLSTIRNADKIVVLDRGRVAEVGNHDQLLEAGGVYAQLYAINYGLSGPSVDVAPVGGEVIGADGLSPAAAD